MAAPNHAAANQRKQASGTKQAALSLSFQNRPGHLQNSFVRGRWNETKHEITSRQDETRRRISLPPTLEISMPAGCRNSRQSLTSKHLHIARQRILERNPRKRRRLFRFLPLPARFQHGRPGNSLLFFSFLRLTLRLGTVRLPLRRPCEDRRVFL